MGRHQRWWQSHSKKVTFSQQSKTKSRFQRRKMSKDFLFLKKTVFLNQQGQIQGYPSWEVGAIMQKANWRLPFSHSKRCTWYLYYNTKRNSVQWQPTKWKKSVPSLFLKRTLYLKSLKWHKKGTFSSLVQWCLTKWKRVCAFPFPKDDSTLLKYGKRWKENINQFDLLFDERQEAGMIQRMRGEITE